MRRFIECTEAVNGQRTMINIDKIETINEIVGGTVITFNTVNGKIGYITLKDQYDDFVEKMKKGTQNA